MAAQTFKTNHAKAEKGENIYGFTDSRNVSAGENVLCHPIFRLFLLGVHVDNEMEQEQSA